MVFYQILNSVATILDPFITEGPRLQNKFLDSYPECTWRKSFLIKPLIMSPSLYQMYNYNQDILYPNNLSTFVSAVVRLINQNVHMTRDGDYMQTISQNAYHISLRMREIRQLFLIVAPTIQPILIISASPCVLYCCSYHWRWCKYQHVIDNSHVLWSPHRHPTVSTTGQLQLRLLSKSIIFV